MRVLDGADLAKFFDRPLDGRENLAFDVDLLGVKSEVDDTLTTAAEFFERINSETYLIIGVESVAAYESLAQLISVLGVDGVFIGPHDMTVSMEVPEKYDNPDFVRMLDDVIRRCRAAKIGVGVHLSQMITPDARFKRLIDKGMNWILYGADVALLVGEMRKRLQDFRSHKGDSYSRAGGKGPKAASCIVPGKAQKNKRGG